MSKPFFSVIIPTFERIDSLRECLCSLEKQQNFHYFDSNHHETSYEIIVSDDSRTSTTQETLAQEFPSVKWIKGPKQGPAANRNHGASHSSGQWLAFTDDDCIPDANWLLSFFDTILSNPETRVLEGAIHPIGEFHQDLAECPVNYEGGNFWSANISVENKMFHDLGGFDESYPYAAHEDQDLKIQLEKITPILFVKNAIIKHPVRITKFKNTLKKLPSISRSWGYHLAKNGKYLNINNVKDVYLQSFYFNLYSMAHNLKCGHLKQAFIKCSYMLVGSIIAVRSYQKHTQAKPA